MDNNLYIRHKENNNKSKLSVSCPSKVQRTNMMGLEIIVDDSLAKCGYDNLLEGGLKMAKLECIKAGEDKED